VAEKREIPSARGYFVDTEGNVYSRWRTGLGPAGPVFAERKLSVRISDGYRCVDLKAAKRKAVNVAWLVLEAFIGPRPDGAFARHLDDNPSNNRLDNLAWGTRKENVADAIRNQCRASRRGEKRDRLTAEKAAEIRARHKAGVTQRELAQEFGVARVTITHIIQGRTWRGRRAA